MPDDTAAPHKLLYAFRWSTCRNTPFLGQPKIRRALEHYFDHLDGGLKVVSWNTPTPAEIAVTVETAETRLAPRQIFWLLSRQTATLLEATQPDLARLPSVWTRNYTVTTRGKA